MTRHLAALVVLVAGTDALRTKKKSVCDVDVDPASKCNLEHWELADWVDNFGLTLPDRPVVLDGTNSFFGDAASEAMFRYNFESKKIWAKKEYSGDWIMDRLAHSMYETTLGELMATWNTTHSSFTDIACYPGSLCFGITEGTAVPSLFSEVKGRIWSMHANGPGSGSAMHKIGAGMWAGHAIGKMAYYMLPPGGMTEAMQDIVGPHIYPVRSYHKILQQMDASARPLYCELEAGEVLYVPPYWWYASMGLEEMNINFGQRLVRPFESFEPSRPNMANASAKLVEYLARFPEQAFDSGAWTAEAGAGRFGLGDPMPFSIRSRKWYGRTRCLDGLDDPEYSLEEPLRRIRLLQGTEQFQCGVENSAAFVHCQFAKWADHVARVCKLSGAKLDSVRLRQAYWRANASAISSSLVAAEPYACS